MPTVIDDRGPGDDGRWWMFRPLGAGIRAPASPASNIKSGPSGERRFFAKAPAHGTGLNRERDILHQETDHLDAEVWGVQGAGVMYFRGACILARDRERTTPTPPRRPWVQRSNRSQKRRVQDAAAS